LDETSETNVLHESWRKEKMSMFRKTLVAIFAVILLSSGASLTQAQNQGYRGTFRTVRPLILRIDTRTNLFTNRIQNALAANTLGANREENISNLASEFDDAVNRLRVKFEARQSTTVESQEVFNLGSRIDRFMRRNPINAATQRDWASLRLDLTQLARAYNVTWPTTVGRNNNGTIPTSPVGGRYGSDRLTGTYRLDTSRSDNARDAAERATQSLTYSTRDRLRNELITRLESPERLAIDVRGRDVTIGSSRAPQISFTADGIERVETNINGRTTRASAALNAGQLVISSTGDRANEFNVTFNPIDDGARLSVTRRVYVQGLSRPVVVQSVYERTSDVAQFEGGTQGYPTTTNSGTEFIVPNGELLVAVLNDDVSTANAREGDRFTLTVRQPSNLDGATIEGRVTQIARSGRVTGRSQMTMNFDSIRLRDGRSYRFAGILESVRTAQGDTVKIDNEGSVRDDNQTNKTVQRAAIGTAVGAIIGAIAGGGKGAAIGAIVGAGGGAGSVYAQGRDDLELTRGTEVSIRATGPR
jgi:hypothetical protein